MNPYLLLTRDPRRYDQMTGAMSHTLPADSHSHGRTPAQRSTGDLSEIISSGTLHAVNAVERGWGRMTSLIGH